MEHMHCNVCVAARGPYWGSQDRWVSVCYDQESLLNVPSGGSALVSAVCTHFIKATWYLVAMDSLYTGVYHRTDRLWLISCTDYRHSLHQGLCSRVFHERCFSTKSEAALCAATRLLAVQRRLGAMHLTLYWSCDEQRVPLCIAQLCYSTATLMQSS